MRDTVFVSHANPEDNDFALWLTLQLASHGYAAWCDLTKLLGGEDFWSDIETTIRERTYKFLYVLSRSSNHKQGCLNELSVAQGVAKSRDFRDFVIPVKIDDLPYTETNIRLNSLNAIRFTKGWADGLRVLLAKLEEDGTPKHPAFSPSVVTDWWQTYRRADEGVLQQPEDYLTNWFPSLTLPEEIYIHRLTRYGGGVAEISTVLPYPAIKHGSYVLSFATAQDLRPAVIEPTELLETTSCSCTMFQNGDCADPVIKRQEARNYLVNLLRQAWELELQRRALPVFTLSGGVKCFYFTQGMAERDRVTFVGVKGRLTYRQIIGYSTISRRSDSESTKRYWHFGIQLKPLLHPVQAFAAKPHVLFSSDGETIWEDTKASHRARRNECKNWWNAEWRDRILAAMTWLADSDGMIALPLGSDHSVTISALPLTVSSPVTYRDPAKVEPPVDLDVVEEWDEFDADDAGEAA
jgi:hypothetical protein